MINPGTKSYNRIIWASTRSVLEALNFKQKRSGKKSKSRWTLFERLLEIFVVLLKITGYYKKGVGNAMHNELNIVPIEFDKLPDELDGYRILHLSDLHFDTIQGTEDFIIDKIKDQHYDLCAITGDYRKKDSGAFAHVMPCFRKLIDHIKAPDGIFAVLGNHDSYLMVEYEEALSPLEFLINEHAYIQKGNTNVHLCGIDDPFSYYTDKATLAFKQGKGDFNIALVHTSEMHDIASQSDYQLYLCGHTHAGQICLPGGKPIITHQSDGKGFFKGLWKSENMFGYTSSGCGVSGIPVRFNTFSEVAIIELRQKK
jgi:predicted MPP superfamily phosphohydrolase